MSHDGRHGLTPAGKVLTFLIVLGLLAGAAWLFWRQPVRRQVLPPVAGGAGGGGAPEPAEDAGPELVEARTRVPVLSPPQPYVMKDGIVDIELSEYAGYAGLIAANGGLAASPDSVFSRRHGFQLRIKLSEEESWSALNSGQMAASATTVDVLAAYGRQFQVVVPAQIGYSRGADGVIVLSDLRRTNALKGRTLATAQFTEADFFLRYLAQEAGIGVAMASSLDAAPDPDRINLVYCEDAFAAGDRFLAELKRPVPRLAGAVSWAPRTTEVVAASGGKARLLVSNRNVLIIADVLVVNRAFAEQAPEVVRGLVHGLLEGNRMVRENPERHLDVVAKAFGWDRAKAGEELGRVHLSNLPENLAFFSSAMDAAGSFSGIYQSAVLAYGSALIPDPVDGQKFVQLAALQALEREGVDAGQKIAIAPFRSARPGLPEGDPLLSKQVRFLFAPNSAVLEIEDPGNLTNLESIQRLLQVSPGSTVLLRGHVDGALVEQFRKEGGETFVRQMALKAMELSRDRAAEIQRVLIERYRVGADRLEIVGRGWEEPVSESRDENRRVEVQWFTVE